MSTPTFQSHLTVLESSARLYATRPAFRLPVLNKETSQISEWATITYAKFHQDVELYARYWTSILSAGGIAPGSIVGLWLNGEAYTEALHIYGVSRAGYIPQTCCIGLPNPIVIFELLQQSGARALVYEPLSGFDLSECPVPTYPAIQVPERDVADVTLPPLRTDYSASDIVFIFHTSGSTSGRPKLVPYNRRFLDNVIMKRKQTDWVLSTRGQDVTVSIGNMLHMGQATRLIGSLYYGSCTIQPTSIPFSDEELLDMIDRCGLNRLRQRPAFLTRHLRNSKTNQRLLEALVQLDDVQYGGSALGREEEAWALQHGINLRSSYGCTEAGPLFVSVGGHGPDASFLVPLKGTSHAFSPIDANDESSTSAAAHQDTTGRLMELVILSDSPNCPDVSLRHADGHFHTSDLFVEVETGKYLFKGRKDDWIKTECASKCDTKSIEDGVRATCGDLIFECVVVGSGRPSPALFVEASEKCTMDDEKLKEEIFERIMEFNTRGYDHERIARAEHIVVIKRGTLPRTATKGNVQRRVVEGQYKELLDSIYATVSKN